MKWIVSLILFVSTVSVQATDIQCRDRYSDGYKRVSTEVLFRSEGPYMEIRQSIQEGDERPKRTFEVLLERGMHCGVDVSHTRCRYFTRSIGGEFKFQFNCSDEVRGVFEARRYGDSFFKCETWEGDYREMYFRGCR